MKKLKLKLEGEFVEAKDGHYLKLSGPGLMIRMLHALKGKVLDIDVSEQTRTRSIDANNMYWAAVVKQGQAYFYEVEGENLSIGDVHEFHLACPEIMGMKAIEANIGEHSYTVLRFEDALLKALEDEHGLIIKKGITRSSSMPTKLFSILIERCVRWYGERGWTIKLNPHEI
jgi:hypothetical protein